MPKYRVNFQRNPHARDLIYELSAAYLIARSIHVTAKIGLTTYIPREGITWQALANHFPDYNHNAILTLLEILTVLGIITKNENSFYPTPLSITLNAHRERLAVSEDDWCSSFNNVSDQYFFNPDVIITITNHCMSYESYSPLAILLELSQLHLLSRAIRIATEGELFELYRSEEESVCLTDSAHRFTSLLPILARYHLVKYNGEPKVIRFSSDCQYLTKHHPETLFFAMLMIDEKWWKAVAYMSTGFKRGTLSAYELTNKSTFYQAVAVTLSRFAKGMAEISLLEDKEVADSCISLLTGYESIIDIGGGEAGLLRQFHQHFGQKKEYILYDQATPTHLYPSNTTFNPQIIVGDFLQDRKKNNIPTKNHAAYFTKCVLHNMKKHDAITLLRNIRFAMGANCTLFMAERIIPPQNQYPHPNLSNNLLMHILFNAESHDFNFYREILFAAGFKLEANSMAGNYMIFVATERPELQFQKNQESHSSYTKFSLQPHRISSETVSHEGINFLSPKL